MKTLDKYEIGDKVQIFTSDALNTNVWVDAEVVDTHIYVSKANNNRDVCWPVVKVKYLRNYCGWKEEGLVYYAKENEEIIFYDNKIKMKDEIPVV